MTSSLAPVVLIHGLFGFNQFSAGGHKVADYFRNIPEALRADGHIVPQPPQLNPAGSVADRAQNLRDYLTSSSKISGKKVHLIAHSMGGLDARYLISSLGMADRVISLTTIGTPHHGSPIADIVIAGTDPLVVEFFEHLGVDLKGAFDLTTWVAQKFNQDTPETDDVRYFSVAGEFEPLRLAGQPFGVLGLTHDIVKEHEGPNDGVVSTRSAAVGQLPANWTFLGVWPVNHFRMINWGRNIVLSLPELGDNSIVERYRALVNQVKSAATNT